MHHSEDRQLIARLLGELDAEAVAEFDRQRRRDPQLDERYQLLLSDWKDLDLAPPPSPLAGSAQRMLAQRRRSPLGGQRLQALGQTLGGAAALMAGLLLGIGLGTAPAIQSSTTTESSLVDEVLVAESLSTENSTLSDAYWQLVSGSSQGSEDSRGSEDLKGPEVLQ
jgi:anti-sigma factor RsiW